MLVAPGQQETSRKLWVHGRAADIALGWCWLPIALVVHAAEPHLTAVQSIMGVIFLISFAHQPLTLGLVYGDPMQRGAHPRPARRKVSRSIYNSHALLITGIVFDLLGGYGLAAHGAEFQFPNRQHA